MTELALESITKLKCFVCGDSLTDWEIENGLCILCEEQD